MPRAANAVAGKPGLAGRDDEVPGEPGGRDEPPEDANEVRGHDPGDVEDEGEPTQGEDHAETVSRCGVRRVTSQVHEDDEDDAEELQEQGHPDGSRSTAWK
jgi:hypothetical protein